MEFTKDCLIGFELKPENISISTSHLTIVYYHESVGNVKVTIPAYNDLLNGDFERYLIAGITRNAYEKKQEPPLIDSQFLKAGYKDYNPPIDFKEKVKHFLKYIYEHGGRENKKFEFKPFRDSAIAFCDPEEFTRLVNHLEKINWITISNKNHLSLGRVFFLGVELTICGITEAEKLIPQMPLIGLVDQKITTGDPAVDEKINHAKKLFFSDASTLDDKRSACETLSHVLEPLRDELSTFFTTSDVSDFFQIVNRFDIRHNKVGTINLKYEEQLEWVFFTLLNTINTYVKLERKYK
jgi:hypothetical protein